MPSLAALFQRNIIGVHAEVARTYEFNALFRPPQVEALQADRPETIPGSYQTLEEAVKACEAGEVAPDETIYIWNVWDKDADIKEENHIYIRTVGEYARQALEAGSVKPREIFKMYHSEDEAMMAYAEGLVDMHDPIKVWKELEIDGKKEHRVIDATVGRLIINDAIPQNLGFKKRETTDEMFPLEIDFVVGKKQLGKIIDNCIRINGFTLSTEMLDKVKNHFPADLASSETADLFMSVIMYRLKQDGRAAVILPDGFLFGTDNAKIAIKKKLLSEFNLHTIIRMPHSVFAPYTSITTNILFFDRTHPTTETWFYRLDMPDGYKNFSKTKPMKLEHFAPAVKWLDNREEITIDGFDKAKKYTVEELKARNYNIDLCGYPHEEEEILPPKELILQYQEKRASLNADIDRILAQITDILGIDITEEGDK